MANESEPSSTKTPVVPLLLGHPIGFFFFFWGEFAERCSYYGMRAILPRYLKEVIELDDSVYYWWKMACYGLPLLGGFLADRYFGKYRTIVWFSVPYIVGHFILGFSSPVAVMIALALLAGGSGVIKPNISTLMGMTYDQQMPGQTQLRSSAFLWFYFSINIGALISTLTLPFMRDKLGYAIAFQFPAWLMVASLAAFASGKPYYAKETLNYQPPTPEERRERTATLGRLFGIFALVVLFFVPYEHNDGVWVFFIRDYVNLKLPFSGTELPPDLLQSINPLCVIIFAPLFGWLFPILDPQARIFTAKNKIMLGFLCGVLSSGLMCAAGYLSNPDVKISMLWVIFAYILLTIGEVLVYGTGLEMAFAEAPASMKSFITGCFLLTSTLANFVNTVWVKFYGGSLTDDASKRGSMSPGLFFGLSGLFVLAALLIMLIMKRDSKPAETDEQVIEL